MIGWLLIAGLGLLAYDHLFSVRSRVATQGTVMLVARVPYRLTYNTRDVLMANPMNPLLVERQADVRIELLRLSAYDIAFMQQPGLEGGEYLVSFAITPAVSVPVAVGSQLAATGVYGTGLKLLKVERLDGKPIR